MKKKCEKCARCNSWRLTGKNYVKRDTWKCYYECVCGNIMARDELNDGKKLNAEKYAEKPDLWWEDLPKANVTDQKDKSQTDFWEENPNSCKHKTVSYRKDIGWYCKECGDKSDRRYR